MNAKLKAKLKTLPNSPGVYFHKSATGEIIYVGKAAVLKNRVRQYFQSSNRLDVKTRALVAEIDNTDWVETDSEIDALFLEAEMIKRYMPRYNILLRDDKSLTYIRIDMKSKRPYVSFTRNPADDGAEYFGPYYSAYLIKKALRYLRRIFPYYIKPYRENDKPSLYDHLGLNPVNLSNEEYHANLRRLISYINGNRKKLIRELTREMKQASDSQEFEQAAILRNKLNAIRALSRQIMFGDKEFLDISKDVALTDLKDLLGLEEIPVRIEGYDISHMSGTNVVASMVVFKNGASDRAEYRKFKMRIDKNNDFDNMREVISRRLSDKNLKAWGKPDLILIDGGKGQLAVALEERDRLGCGDIPFIGLAKKEEQIVVAMPAVSDERAPVGGAAPTERSEGGSDRPAGPASSDLRISPLANIRRAAPTGRLAASESLFDTQKANQLDGFVEYSDNFALINLPHDTYIIKLLQRIRDESHRFAVSYHTSLKRSGQTMNLLEELPGIGPKTRVKLIRKFGSLNGIKKANLSDIETVIGKAKAKLVLEAIKAV